MEIWIRHCLHYLGQKLTVAVTLSKVFQMVFTRSQTPSTFSLSSFSLLDAAKALLSLRHSNVSILSNATVSTNDVSSRVKTSSSAAQPTSIPQGKFWASWTNWYHAFLAEATDENASLPIAERRAIATSRWVNFTSKKLHCSESEVRGWLRKADQKALLAACA